MLILYFEALQTYEQAQFQCTRCKTNNIEMSLTDRSLLNLYKVTTQASTQNDR